MVVRTRTERIQYAPCILLSLVLFGRYMPSIAQKTHNTEVCRRKDSVNTVSDPLGKTLC